MTFWDFVNAHHEGVGNFLMYSVMLAFCAFIAWLASKD